MPDWMTVRVREAVSYGKSASVRGESLETILRLSTARECHPYATLRPVFLSSQTGLSGDRASVIGAASDQRRDLRDRRQGCIRRL